MQHLDDRARREIVSAIAADMKSALAEMTQDDQVVIPFHARIARARP